MPNLKHEILYKEMPRLWPLQRNQTRLLFEDMGKLMRNELQRFEKEKVEDFKSGVETFLESAVEAQKEVIFPILQKKRKSIGTRSAKLTGLLVDRTLGDVSFAT